MRPLNCLPNTLYLVSLFLHRLDLLLSALLDLPRGRLHHASYLSVKYCLFGRESIPQVTVLVSKSESVTAFTVSSLIIGVSF